VLPCSFQRSTRGKNHHLSYCVTDGHPKFKDTKSMDHPPGVVAPAEEIGGQYCDICHVGKIAPDDVTISGVSEGIREYALDPKTAEALWKKSEELVGESF
jgi:hypothetical protein